MSDSTMDDGRKGRDASEVWTDKRNTRAMLGALAAFKGVDPDLGTRAMAAFLLIALKPHQTIAELAQSMGVTVTAASRSVSALALEVGGRPALLRVYPCRLDGRTSRIGLTKQGVDLHRAAMAAFRPRRDEA